MMNERIRELIDKATVPVIETNDYNGMAYETYQFSQELFAELIVRECAAVAGKFVHDNKYKEGGISEFWLKDEIKEHFGVE
jgi:hypothetical protein